MEVIPVIEEQLKINKQATDAGSGVRLRKLIHERIEQVDLHLAREELRVTRVAVNQVLDAPSAIRHQGDVTIVPVFEEREITVKQLVLVEEIHITRVPRTELKTERIKLRREEVIIERQDRLSGEWIVCEEPAAGAVHPAPTGPPPPAAQK